MTDSSAVHLVLQQTDSANRKIQLGNIGKGGLDYNLSVEYHRPGIVYNSIKPAIPVKAKTQNTVSTLFGSGQNTELFGSNSATLGSPSGFADSILAYESGSNLTDFLGTGYDETPIRAVSRFNGGTKGIYLTHVGDLYRTDNMIPSTIKFKIRLGSNINASTVIYEQSVQIQPDTTGAGIYLITKLDSGILINAYEDFWIEWDYAFGMRFPQGIQFVTTDQQKTGTFFIKVYDDQAFSEMGLIADFYMAAYSDKDSTGGWLTMTPDKGSVGIGQTQPLRLTAHGPKIIPTDQSADLVIHSNDPVTPEAKVGIYVHIDQAPVLTSHDTLVVHEADILNILIPVEDDGGGKVNVKLIKKDTAASIKNTGTDNYFIYKPGYNDAGVHYFGISMADNNGNKRTDSLVVMVLNTNRPPLVVNHLKDRIISLKGPAITLGLDSVFMDPDGDAMQYSLASDADPMAKVFVDPTGETGIIPQDTGHINLVFKATDIYGDSGEDTLHLYIKNNTAPVSTGIPYVIVEKGATRILELSDYFSDPDNGDVLSYTATIDSTGYATIEIIGSEMVINGLNVGNRLVTITADDGNGGTISKSFILMVLNKKGDNGYDYHIKVAPNPIHGLAYASFQLDKGKKVHIDLVSIDGKPKGSLFDGTRSAGYQSVLINLYRFPTGNYYLKFTLGEDVRVVQITKF
jgi:hypothetical protein